MFRGAWVPRAARAAAAAAAAGFCTTAAVTLAQCDAPARSPPPPRAAEATSAAWDSNWDCRALSARQVASLLNHAWPIDDYHEATRRILREHTSKSAEQIERVIAEGGADPAALYCKAYRRYAYGGAPVRHILLVRHGQYEEQRELSAHLRATEGARWLDERTFRRGALWQSYNEQQVLTPLGRKQAEKTGDRLAAMLAPQLAAGGREVRLRVSTMTRARETAQIIASRLPAAVEQAPPDPLLEEGAAAFSVPVGFAEADDVHYDGIRIEAAFRSLFYRALPRKPEAAEPRRRGAPRHEFEIVVCHMNVIRYFLLRALQLPPEAWLRFGGFNGSITHLRILPDGTVKCDSFGDAGHLDLEETTFGSKVGWER
ncbi:hypothetical protein AB1Y20_008885 [Prymnesium parvum]|uniref:Serine/threonine-protein phosphatase PGAM5, mitochondrial n=1 Tax=Prymnesium parvum TaxID=97485 RepID=A0AB34IRS3_PRYPA